MYLGLVHKGQDGQAAIFVLLMLLAVTAMLILGLRITELATLRFDSQKGADAAALAGANIQSQGRMVIAVLKSFIMARNLLLAIMRIIAGVLAAISVILAGTLALAPVAGALMTWATTIFEKALAFEMTTMGFVKAIKGAIYAAKLLYPFYALGNAIYYAAQNGSLAAAVPFSWGWIDQTADALRRRSGATADEPPPESVAKPDCAKYVEMAQQCQCFWDAFQQAALLDNLDGAFDAAREHIARQLAHDDDDDEDTKSDALTCKLAIEELLPQVEDVRTRLRDMVDARARALVRSFDPCATDEFDPEILNSPSYQAVGCLAEIWLDHPVAELRASISADGCQSCDCFADSLESVADDVEADVGKLWQMGDLARAQCDRLRKELLEEAEAATEKETESLLAWIDTSLDNDRLVGLDGIAVVAFQHHGRLSSGYTLNTRLSDGTEVGLVYAVAYGKVVMGESILFSTWGDSTRNRLAREEFGLMFVGLGALSLLIDAGRIFFEVVQWFHDIEQRASGFFPAAPSSLPEQVAEVWNRKAREATRYLLELFNLQNAPDMHEWRPGLERFDVALMREDPTSALERLHGWLYTVVSRLDSALSEISAVASEADSSLSDVSMDDLGGRPILPGGFRIPTLAELLGSLF